MAGTAYCPHPKDTSQASIRRPGDQQRCGGAADEAAVLGNQRCSLGDQRFVCRALNHEPYAGVLGLDPYKRDGRSARARDSACSATAAPAVQKDGDKRASATWVPDDGHEEASCTRRIAIGVRAARHVPPHARVPVAEESRREPGPV
jgi:hypothetical protein